MERLNGTEIVGAGLEGGFDRGAERMGKWLNLQTAEALTKR
jgi:hypothetical protein